MKKDNFNRGALPLGCFVVLFVALALLFADRAYISSKECSGSYQSKDCFWAHLIFDGLGNEDSSEKGSVTATGTISGELGGKDRVVNIKMTFPLEGGAVHGTFNGTGCSGLFNGTYAGGSVGTVGASGGGSCGYLLPVEGNITGIVKKMNHSAYIEIEGSAGIGPLKKSGRITTQLSYVNPAR